MPYAILSHATMKTTKHPTVLANHTCHALTDKNLPYVQNSITSKQTSKHKREDLVRLTACFILLVISAAFAEAICKHCIIKLDMTPTPPAF